jgi:type I restriction enzyme S subunit
MEMMLDIAKDVSYPAYKSSGVDWIGEIPKHWEIRKLKHLFFEKRKKTNPELNCGSISFGKVVVKDDEKIPLSTKASYQEVLKGDFLINPLNLNYDLISLRIALSEIDVVVSSGYIVLKNSAKINLSYYKWLLHRYDVAYMKLLGSGVRQTINFGDIADSLLVFPPLEEQARIAQFLDRKSTQIDQAIVQKEKLIELLKERRQILIHNAVTRGLNSNVKMKDSGVEWIGEVPHHWQVIANRVLFSERNEPGNGNLPILSVSIHTAVSSEELDGEENIRGKIRIEDKSKYKFVDVGDIVFNMMRAWQGAIGSVSVQGMVSPAYIVAKPKCLFNSDFFEYLYRTEKFIQQMDRVSKGITDFRKRLYWNEFKQLVTVSPPENEQKQIVSFISRLHQMTSAAIESKEKEIGKLKEYKATLINSAVTGKIKV